MQNENFEFLKGTIRLLICSAVSDAHTVLLPIFSAVPLYDVSVLSSTQEAIRALAERRVHLCLLDCSEERLVILKKFRYISFVGICNNEASSIGFKYAQERVQDMITFADLNKFETEQRLHNHALRNIVNPYYGDKIGLLNVATDILIEKRPENITRWALEMQKTERHMRNIFANLKCQVKLVHFIFTTYAQALAYYQTGKVPNKYKNIVEYFFSHRSRILDYIHRKV